MIRKPALTVENLIELGARKLAELVLDEAKANAPFRKRANAALAGAQGADAVAALIDRRLAALEKARSAVDWRKEREFTADLKATVQTIMGELAALDPAVALTRLVRFLASSGQVLDRAGDSGARLQKLYQHTAKRLPELLDKLSADALAGVPALLTTALEKDPYGLIASSAIEAAGRLPEAVLAEWDGALAQAGPKDVTLLLVRQAIAEARGDLDGYIALETQRPLFLIDPLRIAGKLLDAKRFDEALDWVRRESDPGFDDMGGEEPGYGRMTFSRELPRAELEARILAAKGDNQAAQALRWKTFETTLSAETLRAYIAALGDFEEFDELDRAFAVVEASPSAEAALEFYIAWPQLDRAAKLVMARRDKWNGRHYYLLAEAAAALEDKYGAAAVVLYRTLVDDILGRGLSTAYGYAANYLARLCALAQAGDDGDHDRYLAGLEKAHGRKYGFWSAFNAQAGG